MARAALTREQRRALDRLIAARPEPAVYLAGGCAVAVHLGHRRSRDLNLFSFAELSFEPYRALTASPDVAILAETDAALSLPVGDVPVDIVRYPYPLVDPPIVGPGGAPTAGLRDLAAMKLAAIAKRGLRRDFWDLWAIVNAGVTLVEAGEVYKRRFGRSQADLYHVWRALTFFDDAEREPVFPEGLSARRWSTIRRFFEDAARDLLPT
ncbi:MAG: nucleotidyl transferase AbiEii/AbiGii toxin family protein [Myxococcales bacterium]|nr:nucleotidyl transferase AbiEii/AbiGii toxin family protein [Myxococcales bacterium]